MNCRHAKKNIKVIVSKDRDFPPFIEKGISLPFFWKEWVRKILSPYINKIPWHHQLGQCLVTLCGFHQRDWWNHLKSFREQRCAYFEVPRCLIGMIYESPIQRSHDLIKSVFIPASSNRTMAHTLIECDVKRIVSSLVRSGWQILQQIGILQQSCWL